MFGEFDIRFWKLDELSNARISENEIVRVAAEIIDKANEAVTSTHHTKYSTTALSMEREVIKPGVFIKILVVPIQCVELLFIFEPYRPPSPKFHLLREELEE